MEEIKVSDRGHPDGQRSKLRGIVARIERELPDNPVLQAAWRELGDALALGPEPATRVCPTCLAVVMREATRCGHCWLKLVKSTPTDT